MVDDKQPKFRVRLHFDESIGFGEDEEEKRKCWFLCHKKSTIGDLVSSIMKDFNLKNQCPHGIILYLEQYALISNQNIDILRETDIVTVKKKLLSKKRERELSSQQPDGAKKPKVVAQSKTRDSEESSEEESDEESEKESSEEDKPSPPKQTTNNIKPIQTMTTAKLPPKQEAVSKPAAAAKQPQKTTPAPKATPPAAKQTTAPKAEPKPAPVSKKFSSDSDSSEEEEEEESKPKANGAKSPAPKQATQPATKQNATQSKGHIKFDDLEDTSAKRNQVQSPSNKSNSKAITLNNSKPSNNNKTAIQQQDRLENVSVILQRGNHSDNNHNNNNQNGFQKPVKLKPVRDYNSFPLLQQKDTIQRGDLLAFNMLDLYAWNPELVRKEGVVESYNAKEDTITIRLDAAFKVPKSLNVPQSLLKAKSKENRYLTFQDWKEGADEEEEEESETEEVITVPRGDLSDVRIIERNAT